MRVLTGSERSTRHERIAGVICRTIAYGKMIDGLAVGIDAAGSGARIFAFIIYASSV